MFKEFGNRYFLMDMNFHGHEIFRTISDFSDSGVKTDNINLHAFFLSQPQRCLTFFMN